MDEDQLENSRESFEFKQKHKRDYFTAKFRLPQFTILNGKSIEKYKIDFMQYFDDLEKGTTAQKVITP